MSRFSWSFLVLFAAVVLASICRLFILQTFDISSSSMLPTLLVGDRVLVSKLSYGISVPGRSARVFSTSGPRVGDVIVFRKITKNQGEQGRIVYVKRVIAVPGDVVELQGSQIAINGKKYHGEYHRLKVEKEQGLTGQTELSGSTNVEGVRYDLAADEYFVMGDNLSESQDSRDFGPILLQGVIGKVQFVYWSSEPLNGPSRIRWERVFRKVS